ncbi:MAG TPA: cobalamin biosynthesis protein [Propionibacteriaceae bacterium]|nr:cobalamin biosynthesis protein [Propionibacteriaceae bacterium]
MSGWPGAVGLGLGYLADVLLGDPRRWHPVAGFGGVANWLEQRTYADARLAGVGHTLLLVGGTVGLGALAERSGAGRPLTKIIITGLATWTVLGGRSLTRAATAVAEPLATGDVAVARAQVRHLVGREVAELSESEVARATVESVAENTSDAVVAPLLWGAALGIPGLLGHRAVNTLDAMVGYRSPRYERFGWAAARLDDLANWVPARVAGLAAALTARLVGGSPPHVLRVVRRDAGQHPSPNAGVVEAAFAGALGIRLGGRNVYRGQVEERGVLGEGPVAAAADIPRANRLAAAVSLTALGLAMLIRGARR